MLSGAPRVVLTGGAESLPGLSGALRAEGLRVEERPLLSFGPPESWAPLDAALRARARYQAIAVTSPRAAQALAARVAALGLGRERLPPVWTGPAGRERLLPWFGVVRVPEVSAAAPGSLGVQLAGAILEAGGAGPVLFPCGDHHRDELPALLAGRGVRVEPVPAYRTVLAPTADAVAAIAAADILVVTSPRAAALVVSAAPGGNRPALVAIGPTTARAAARAGWPPDATAALPTAALVARALLSLLSGVR